MTSSNALERAAGQLATCRRAGARLVQEALGSAAQLGRYATRNTKKYPGIPRLDLSVASFCPPVSR